MTVDEFWRLIDNARHSASDTESRPDALRQELSELAAPALVEFYECYSARIDEACQWDLWGAAYLMLGGCSDDGFDYFRDWLISEGRDVFERALVDAESLAELAKNEEAELELFRYVVDEVYEARTGAQMQPPARDAITDPAGEEWDEESLESKFPKLAAKYG